jgi:hypothetical protein
MKYDEVFAIADSLQEMNLNVDNNLLPDCFRTCQKRIVNLQH